MLSRKFKIERKDFPKDLRLGKVLYSPHLSLFVFKHKIDKPSRFSFVVSSKISKKATKRNLLRRRGYDVISEVITFTKASSLCVFYFKKGSDKISFAETKKEIISLLEKSSILPK